MSETTDHRIAPPRSRRGSSLEDRKTRGKLEAEKQAQEVAMVNTTSNNRGIALLAAGSAWSGISAVKDRDKSVLETADKFLAWLEG